MPVHRLWSVIVLRAVPAAAAALIITFSADHSARLGMLVLGGFAIATGIVLGFGALRGALPVIPFVVEGVLLIVGGAIALVFLQGDIAALLFLTSAVFGASGIVELLAGLRARGTTAAARDWIFVGALSAVFAVVVLLIPADFHQVITIQGKVVPPLTASVIVVGALGAYAAIVAVYLVIAGLSLKWATDPSAVVKEV